MKRLAWLVILLVISATTAFADTAKKIVTRARLEAQRSVVYDARYRRISYPNGDIPANVGVCADVIVRSLRAAGYDLQRLIAEDKQRQPRAYRGRLDRNIDHRRTRNHLVFFKKYAQQLTTRLDREHLNQWRAGDLVYIELGGGLLHCGVVSDIKNEAGIPLLIHNIGPVARENDSLTSFKIIAHFRYPRPQK